MSENGKKKAAAKPAKAGGVTTRTRRKRGRCPSAKKQAGAAPVKRRARKVGESKGSSNQGKNGEAGSSLATLAALASAYAKSSTKSPPLASIESSAKALELALRLDRNLDPAKALAIALTNSPANSPDLGPIPGSSAFPPPLSLSGGGGAGRGMAVRGRVGQLLPPLHPLWNGNRRVSQTPPLRPTRPQKHVFYTPPLTGRARVAMSAPPPLNLASSSAVAEKKAVPGSTAAPSKTQPPATVSKGGNAPNQNGSSAAASVPTGSASSSSGAKSKWMRAPTGARSVRVGKSFQAVLPEVQSKPPAGKEPARSSREG